MILRLGVLLLTACWYSVDDSESWGRLLVALCCVVFSDDSESGGALLLTACWYGTMWWLVMVLRVGCLLIDMM